MHFYGADIPDRLVEAAYSGTLVIFAGAGVSMQKPVCLPSFDNLVVSIKRAVDPANRCRDRRFVKLADNSIIYKETPEQYLSYLEKETSSVRAACCSALSTTDKTSNLHKNILRLFPNYHSMKIVTTNFDKCFETALKEAENSYDIYSSPALPFGDAFEGLIHIHGVTSRPDSMVLLAEDYGKAYVTNGWATRFLVDLFSKFTVLFIGYSCGDSLVDYLTRSISGEIAEHSYALCKADEDNSDWRVRGVIPITYDEYDDLPFVIGEWADYLEQTITDRVRKLKEIAIHSELNREEEEYVIHSLQWHNEDDRALFAHEFCSVSNNINHFEFLNENGLATFLTKESLNGAEWELLQWVVSSFSVENRFEFQKLCSPIRNELSLRFFDRLTWHFLLTEAPSEAVGPWIAWLESMPSQYYSYCVHALLELVAKCTEPEICFAIIRMVLRVNLSVANDVFSGVRQEPAVAINDRYYEKRVIEGLNKHKSAIGNKVFNYCIQQIELAYSIQTGCWTIPNAFDSMSYSRSSVEPHDQDQFADGAGSILLDVARESIDPAFAKQAIEKCLDSDCAILIRLGLWLTKEYSCSGLALDLIRENDYLSNIYLHHEVFQLVRSSFDIATDRQKDKFADYLKSYFSSKDDSDYECFNICNWILERTQFDKIVQLRNEILSRNPNYLPREHPDFTHYMTSGFVENSSECKIEVESFNTKNMIYRLSQLPKQGSFISELDIVSVPSRDYPETAFDIIRSLSGMNRSAEETHLCNLLIKTVEWSAPCISAHEACNLFIEILNQPDLSIEGVKALASFTLSGSNKIEWEEADLGMMLESASRNTGKFITAEPAIEPRDDSDWLLIGINHPAGKYLQLIAELDKVCFRKFAEHSKLAKKLLLDLGPISLNESIGAKSLIACYFESLNLWIEVDKDYAQSAVSILDGNDWALLPAWQGMARLNGLTATTWNLTSDCWKRLFSGGISIDKEKFDALVRLYVWIAIVHASETDKIQMLKCCGSWSKSAFEAACYQIDNWLETLDNEMRLHNWNTWLSESFEFIASTMPSGGNVLANMYCRWIRKYPDLRPSISVALTRDCANINEKELFVHDGTLSELSIDESLAPSDASRVIAFLLNHQRHFMYENDARAAATHIDVAALSKNERSEIEDAYTRKGMSNIVFGTELDNHPQHIE